MLLPYCDGVEELGWFWAELNCQGKPSPWLEVRQRLGFVGQTDDSLRWNGSISVPDGRKRGTLPRSGRSWKRLG